MPLTVYHKKRNFRVTPEPFGRKKKQTKKSLYLIQKHAASHLHYDLRLELDGVLKSWAVPKGPSLDPAVKRLAIHVEDHPIEYGSFEGIIPAGEYGGGTVMLWDQGEWVCEEENPRDAYKRGSLTFLIKGKKLKGLWKLVRIKSNPKNWLLIKANDAFAKSADDYDITVEKPNSVKSKRSIEGIAKQFNVAPKKSAKKKVHDIPRLSAKKIKMPTRISPQLATLVSEPPDGDDWLHEIKWDGYRIISFIKDDQIKLMTRNGQDWTSKFPFLVKEIKNLNLSSAIFDGEIVALNKKKHADFQILQNALHQQDTSAIFYHVFDLIYYEGMDFSALPLSARKEQLKKIIGNSHQRISYSDHIIGKGVALFKKACKMGLEGIVSKKVDAPYLQKRTRDWLKIKCLSRQEFIIVGFTKPTGARKYFGSLLLAVYDESGKLRYCGNVGTGFTQQSLKDVAMSLAKYTTKTMPLTSKPKGLASVTWVEPKMEAEVEFTEWTKDGSLRQPSFKGIRSDKPLKEIRREKVETVMKTSKKNALPFHLSHSERILYPEQRITKQELAEFYWEIKDWILPYIINRPLTLVRCPKGYSQKCFFQKHMNMMNEEGLFEIDIKEKKVEAPYIYIKDAKGLISLVQLGVLEIHIWGCHVDRVEKPDFITFDLDPAEGLPWKKVVEAAFLVKNELEKNGLESFVKTTGGKGLHVVVPIKRQYDFREVEIFSHTFVDYLVSLQPNAYTSNMSKAKRKGKIFIDYLRNQRGATAIAPYSTRAREGATVSTPLHWDELKATSSDTYNLRNIVERLKKLKKDPWKDFLKIKQGLKLPKL